MGYLYTMGQKFTITESERNQIRGLYEQSTPPQSGTTQTVQPQIQGSFEYGTQGLNPYVIVVVNGLNQQDIYNKTINWVKSTWQNPDKVIKMTIPNEKIRIEGFDRLLTVNKMSMNMGYTVEISIKDGKLKFELNSILAAPDGIPTGYNYMQFPNFKTDEKTLKHFGNSAVNIENHFNNLVKKLSDYIAGSKNPKDDW